MKVEIELFGASRDFSEQNSLNFEVDNNSTIKDIRNKIINYLSPLGFEGSDEGFTVGDITSVIMQVSGVLFVDSLTLSVASGNSSSGTAHSSLYQITSGNVDYLAKGILPKLTSSNLTTNLTAVTVS